MSPALVGAAAALVVALAFPRTAAADLLPSPATTGDYSLGLGPVLVLEPGARAAGARVEANLLRGLWSLGAHGRASAGPAGARFSAGIEGAFLGAVGLGASVHAGGALSLDGLLAVPLPLLSSGYFLAAAWRPGVLLSGGSVHVFSIEFKWSSLLVPDEG